MHLLLPEWMCKLWRQIKCNTDNTAMWMEWILFNDIWILQVLTLCVQKMSRNLRQKLHEKTLGSHCPCNMYLSPFTVSLRKRPSLTLLAISTACSVCCTLPSTLSPSPWSSSTRFSSLMEPHRGSPVTLAAPMNSGCGHIHQCWIMYVDGMNNSVSHQQYAPQPSQQHKISFNDIWILHCEICRQGFCENEIAKILTQGHLRANYINYIHTSLENLHAKYIPNYTGQTKLGSSHCTWLWRMTMHSVWSSSNFVKHT